MEKKDIKIKIKGQTLHTQHHNPPPPPPQHTEKIKDGGKKDKVSEL